MHFESVSNTTKWGMCFNVCVLIKAYGWLIWMSKSHKRNRTELPGICLEVVYTQSNTRYLEKKTIRSFFPWRCFDNFLVFPVPFGDTEAAGGDIPSSVHWLFCIYWVWLHYCDSIISYGKGSFLVPRVLVWVFYSSGLESWCMLKRYTLANVSSSQLVRT